MYPASQQSQNRDTEHYIKARHDLIEALNSFGDLTSQQKERLVVEVFGAAAVKQVLQIMQHSNYGGDC